MDVFTHLLLPYVVALLLRRPRAERLAAAIGGYAPDLDVLWTWVPRVWPQAYPFVHRGFSHTIWGGALLAIGLLWVVTRPPLARRSRLLSAAAFTTTTAAVAAAGSLSHTLLLDALTITGTPAFWPVTTARWSVNFFFWGVSFALPVSLAVLLLRWRGRLSDRGVLLGGALVLAVILVAAGIRVATHPDVRDGDVLVPTSNEARWVLARPIATAAGEHGWRVSEVEWGRETAARTYHGNATAPALAAAAACRDTGAYVAWQWGGTRAEIVNATAIPGGWRLLFGDAAARFDYEEGDFAILGWKPPFGPNVEAPYEPEKRGMQCAVVDGRVVETLRPVSFWG